MLTKQAIVYYFFYLLLFMITPFAQAANIDHFSAQVSEIGRYSTVALEPTDEQRNPLLTLVQVRFPTAIVTINDAVSYLLRYSGYQLVSPEHQEEGLRTVLAKPLPVVDRTLGTLSLQDALEVLVGKDVFYLVQDPIHRLVNFHIKPHYNQLTHR